MRKGIRIAALLLALLLLCGCNRQDKMNRNVQTQLQGIWMTTLPQDGQTTRELLEIIDFTETEMELVSVDGPEFVKTVHFDGDLYRFSLDIDACRESVRDFYGKVFAGLYEKRTQLNQVHQAELDEMTYGEFLDFYGKLYGYISGEKMLDGLAATAYDYEKMASVEAGTYVAERKNLINCVPAGEDGASGTVRFSVEGDILTLTFADGDEVYKRMEE